jgi:hypothetical protein
MVTCSTRVETTRTPDNSHPWFWFFVYFSKWEHTFLLVTSSGDVLISLRGLTCGYWWSSNLGLRREMGQVACTHNNPHVKYVGVYYMWIVWVTRKQGLGSQKLNPVGWSSHLHWMMLRVRMCALIWSNIHKIKGATVQSPCGLDPCAMCDHTTWHPVMKWTSALAHFGL